MNQATQNRNMNPRSFKKHISNKSKPEQMKSPEMNEEEITNQVFLKGEICQEIKFGKTENNHEFAQFSIATEESWLDENGKTVKTKNYHQVKAWDQLAKVVQKGFSVGQTVKLKGKLKTNRYGSEEDKKYFTYVHLTQLKSI